jgi:hypothetical protein
VSKQVHPRRLDNPTAKRPKVSNRDMDTLVRAAWEQGWWCVEGGRNYVKCYPIGWQPDDPDTEQSQQPEAGQG